MAFDTLFPNRISGDALGDEVLRQYRLLASDAPARWVATVLAYLLCGAFLDWNIVVLFGFMNLFCDIGSLGLMRRVDPVAQIWRYRLCLALGFLTEIAYLLPPAMMWHLESPYAKAFSVGMIVTGIMHVTTVRATFHRYVIDANRDPAGVSLYPGQNTTGLCPIVQFSGEPVYLDGEQPAPAEGCGDPARHENRRRDSGTRAQAGGAGGESACEARADRAARASEGTRQARAKPG